MASILFVGRPLAMLAQNLFANQAIAANVAGRITWQSHWYVMRKAWRFFQRDFVGRIANQVLQTGPAVRESLVMLLTSVWHILVYGTSALVLLASVDVWLAVPVALWLVGYLALLRTFVPRLRSRARAVSEARSNLSGRMTDSYTNILTIKLFELGQSRRRTCSPGDRAPCWHVSKAAPPQHAVQPFVVFAQFAAGHQYDRVCARALAA